MTTSTTTTPTTSLASTNKLSAGFSRTLSVILFLFAMTTLVSQSAMDLFASVFALFFLIACAVDRKWGARLSAVNGAPWAFIWVLSFAFSLALNRSGLNASLKLLDFRWLFLAAFIGSFLSLHPLNQKILSWLAWIFTFCALYAVLVFFLRFNPLAPSDYEVDQFRDGVVRTGGFLVQPIVFAHLYSLWLAFFFAVLAALMSFQPQAWKERHSMSLMVATTCGLIAILFSFTRGAWIALFFSFLLTSWLLRPRWGIWLVVVTAVIGVSLFVTWPTVQERFTEALHGESERRWMLRANWQMFLEHPWFGVGYAENVRLLPEYYQKVGAPKGLMVSHAHNQYLHVLAGTGVVGFAAYLAFWIFVLRSSFTAFQLQRTRNPWHAALLLGIFGVTVCYLFGGLTECNFEHSKIRYTLALCLGLLAWLVPRRSS